MVADSSSGGAPPKARTARPDWVQANPARIAATLDRALAKPSGGWFVLGASRSFGGTIRQAARHTLRSQLLRGVRPGQRRADPMLGPWPATIADEELVVWRSEPGGALHVAPASCPHMGAHLADGAVRAGALVCPWHGLALCEPHGKWRQHKVHDDGVLVWVQRDPAAADALNAPILPKRPDVFLDGVIRVEAACEPADVIANRLDPWHGAHFHPYAFTALRVIEETDDAIDLVVSYKVLGSLSIEVTARFETPEPRTIVMTIIDGEGTGSVVETHATPIVSARPGQPPRTAVIEATLATSDRPGFIHALRGSAIARPLIESSALRLWKDDARYAERRYFVRQADQ
jgi:nitrite reductase/ring-hydroxylating ferredoxin subunit